MWRRFRAILLSHAIASWIATPVLWIYQLFFQPGPMPSNLLWSNLRHDPQFWLSFSAHEVAAPIFVPIILIYMLLALTREIAVHVLILSATYIIAGSLFLAWWWRRQNARLIRDRLHRGQCHGCGYDLRVTPNRCPECGTLPPGSLVALYGGSPLYGVSESDGERVR